MKNRIVNSLTAMLLAMLMLFSLAACGTDSAADDADYTVGICNYVDDASLNQIVDNIQTTLAAIGEENGVTIKVL